MHDPLLHIAFIHGYGSSPQGDKAVALRDWCAQRQLPYLALARSTDEPETALKEYHTQLRPWQGQRQLLIGSSLGGFFALQLARSLQLPCLLINPAIQPQQSLRRRDLPEGFCAMFESYDVAPVPNMTVLLASDDEVLDHRVALAHYGTQATILLYPDQGHRWRDLSQLFDAIPRAAGYA